MELTGKVVVITGAFGQLGRAMTQEALHQGAQCALLDVVTREAPAGAVAWQVDLSSLPDVARVMNEVAIRFGRIDALVNIAGGFRWQTVASSDALQEWQQQFAINLMTCVNASKAVLPHLQRAGTGRIVNIGAMGALKGANGMGPYAASKSGVMRFTESLADEVKLQGITVNAVLPSTIDTPQNRADMPDADHSRWVKGEDIAKTIAFLLSDAAGAITGALLPVTGKT
ncbi:SDR family NAD(P)-dependent oxidoreductase [Caenimonas koreensis]|uniref:SDR family NAD(P)-dependent oxidoreductase n=1 Tax=Caenimonas koreensis DSM 17982 TaxID=1121255 RepID=A0A844B6H2_9BURK|nr:SDR family NAD(P)-dependent oxidoreductase [Caenimonas koreensis]MRD48772.1 SDR family NAD(P)-dependent oxidoreductase [Caenimonas koreensis DSM 17982]